MVMLVPTFNSNVKALTHGAIFLTTCNAIVFLGASQFGNIFLTYQTFVTNLHLRVELNSKLQEKLHRVTGSSSTCN